MTPHQYRIRRRLDLAKQLLAAGHHSVTDVCMEVGFSSLGSFSALFAQRIGVPSCRPGTSGSRGIARVTAAALARARARP
ncbi:helix-turn-helix transcriptional regulator [Sorangium sp. So ce117]|uniref:helix-turn-helix transcriptional regulator n=1 Tax=Sorangium sp. So ce117 TaxID=3133277 RepID=UPI003F5F3121